MKRKHFKLWSFITALCILLGLLPASVLADIPANLTNETANLVVHSTTGSYAELGGPSTILVQRPDDTEIEPVGGVYSGVPDGASISMEYKFHLVNDDGVGNIYTYSGSNYFDITLPEGINFNAPTTEQSIITAWDKETEESWTLGTWAFTDANHIRVSFDPDVANHGNIYGKVGVSGTFSAFEEETESTTLTLGTQEITFVREAPPAPLITLSKSRTYDAASNTITWTVTVTPPAGVDLKGYTLIDQYSSNQSFVSNSFYLGATQILDANLDLTTANQVRYTFLTGAVGTQTVTYQTRPTSFSAETGATTSTKYSLFTNTASLQKNGSAAAEPAYAELQTNWISKAGNLVTTTDGSILIRWRVTITVPGGGTVTGASVVDTLPANLQLVDDATYDVTMNPGSGAITALPGTGSGTYTYSYTNEDTASTLTYRFPASGGNEGVLTGSAVVTYYTKVVDRNKSLDSNNSVAFKNNAAFSYSGMPDTEHPPRDNVSVTAVPTGGLISKSGGSTSNYTYPGYIHWTITVNRNDVSIPGAAVTDSVPLGQQLLIDAEHPLTVKREGTTVFTAPTETSAAFTSTDSFVRNFSYAFGGTITDTYTIDYYTKIIDVNPDSVKDTSGLDTLYKNNDSVQFGNIANLTRTDKDGSSANVNKTYGSQMLAKTEAESYNYVTHIMKWQITVNRNRLPLHNASVSDTLPPGMVLLIDPEHPFIVLKAGETIPLATAPTTRAVDSSSFTYDFPAEISDQYTITFYAQVTDETLATQWSGNKDFTNNAYLTGTEIDGSINAHHKISIRNPVVSKEAGYTAGSDYVDWKVVINPAKMNLLTAKVIDKLDPGLQIDPASIKLYRVDVAADGTVAAAAPENLLTGGYTVVLPTAENENTLEVYLPDGKYAYRLFFTTYILSDDLDFRNSISLSGSTGTPGGEAKADRIVINNLWSGGGSGTLALTVFKSDGGENPLPVPGAVYQLLNFNGDPILRNGKPVTATTDEFGNAVFQNLPNWVFYAKEIEAPEGYLLNPVPFGGKRPSESSTFQTSDDPALGDIVFNKTSLLGEPLDGAWFVLTGTDYDGNAVSRTAESKDGVVTFKDLPLGSYSIAESEAPKGYYRTDTVITATVEYTDDTHAGVTVTLSADTVQNTLITGSIAIWKKNGKGELLQGAEFTLYDKDGVVVAVLLTDEDGTALFSGLVPGDYTIKETAAPKGYLKSKDILSVTVVGGQIHDFTVTNLPEPPELPKSGGLWDTSALLTLGGGLVLLGLALVFLGRRRERYLPTHLL